MVAAADGVPGVFRSTAAIEPPYIEPQKSPQSMTMAVAASSWYTSGSSSMIPVDPERPGSAPMTTPTIVPNTISRNVIG